MCNSVIYIFRPFMSTSLTVRLKPLLGCEQQVRAAKPPIQERREPLYGILRECRGGFLIIWTWYRMPGVFDCLNEAAGLLSLLNSPIVFGICQTSLFFYQVHCRRRNTIAFIAAALAAAQRLWAKKHPRPGANYTFLQLSSVFSFIYALFCFTVYL